MVFVDRRRRGDRFLEWKVRLFSVAAVLALGGIYLDERWVAGAAIPVLAVAMLLRFLPGSGAAPGDDDEDEDGDEDEDAEEDGDEGGEGDAGKDGQGDGGEDRQGGGEGIAGGGDRDVGAARDAR